MAASVKLPRGRFANNEPFCQLFDSDYRERKTHTHIEIEANERLKMEHEGHRVTETSSANKRRP